MTNGIGMSIIKDFKHINMEQLSFLFYLNWKEQIEDLDEEELRRFIYNLINYHLGVEVDLKTKTDRILWKGVLPGLQANQKKYSKKVEASSKNGQLGGAPLGNQNARKYETTQNNPNKVIRDNNKEVIDNSKMKNANSEEENGNSKLKIENWQQEIDNSKIENEVSEARDTGAKNLDLNICSPNEISLEDLQSDYMAVGNKIWDLKKQIAINAPHQKNIQKLILNDDWALLKSNLNAEEFAVIKPLIEELNSLKIYSSEVYQNIVVKINAAKNGQETNDQ